MKQCDCIKVIQNSLTDLKNRKKTCKIQITIDMNSGGIGKAKMFVGQNFEELLKEKTT